MLTAVLASYAGFLSRVGYYLLTMCILIPFFSAYHSYPYRVLSCRAALLRGRSPVDTVLIQCFRARCLCRDVDA
ncbi:uncharacterized protein SCHCODRAFT_02630236 [Schizophyllum commune H4-8]|uniref:uncharacterized protein n=1 Tax=Schizophyllum commune (strain H4-8 / FGSC 9210) TaxID=578458 RepID=UPI00215EA67C|nr:uncharacterized protein SCHCODRAFT_02630236 [Schizophyllum commune H4-8]KAI5891863.1 hypothetical protein SCHCODRAFT_02630236 [Schizophyllum commune H4-8]